MDCQAHTGRGLERSVAREDTLLSRISAGVSWSRSANLGGGRPQVAAPFYVMRLRAVGGEGTGGGGVGGGVVPGRAMGQDFL